MEQIIRDEEVATVIADEVPPWIIDPKSSKFYRFLTILITIALLAELVLIPLV